MDFESLQVSAKPIRNGPLCLGKGKATDWNGPDLGDHNHPVALDRHDVAAVQALFRDVPDMDRERIQRTKHVVRPNRRIEHRRKTRRLRIEKIIPELMEAAFDALEHGKLCKRLLDRIVLARQLSRLLCKPGSVFSLLL